MFSNFFIDKAHSTADRANSFQSQYRDLQYLFFFVERRIVQLTEQTASAVSTHKTAVKVEFSFVKPRFAVFQPPFLSSAYRFVKPNRRSLRFADRSFFIPRLTAVSNFFSVGSDSSSTSVVFWPSSALTVII